MGYRFPSGEMNYSAPSMRRLSRPALATASHRSVQMRPRLTCSRRELGLPREPLKFLQRILRRAEQAPLRVPPPVASEEWERLDIE